VKALATPQLHVEVNAIGFLGAELSAARLRERLVASPRPPPWLEPLRDWAARALEGGALERGVASLTGEVTLGLARASPFPSLYGAVQVRDAAAAGRTLALLTEFVPSDLGDVLRLLSRRSERTVEGVRVVVREIPVAGGLGWGLHDGWLFGGGLVAAEGMAAALAGKGWKPSPLAAEVLAGPAHAVGWVDARAVVNALRRASLAGAPLERIWQRLGRLPEALRDAGFALRAEAGRIVGRAFVRYEDL